jgi:hypothetical protein
MPPSQAHRPAGEQVDRNGQDVEDSGDRGEWPCHVGFNLVKMLLEDGYDKLRVSVRDKHDPTKTAALKALGVTDIVSLDQSLRDTMAELRALA